MDDRGQKRYNSGVHNTVVRTWKGGTMATLAQQASELGRAKHTRKWNEGHIRPNLKRTR